MKPGESMISPWSMSVTPGYCEAMGIRMVRGGSFDDRDNQNAPRLVIVDERLAQHFWPDRDPIGRRMYLPGDAKDLLKIDEHTVWLTVVGVARTLRYENLDGSGAPVGRTISPIRSNQLTALPLLSRQLPIRTPSFGLFAQRSPASIPTWRFSMSTPCRNGLTFPCPPAGLLCFWPTPSAASPCSCHRSEFMACWRILSRSATAEMGFSSRSAATL